MKRSYIQEKDSEGVWRASVKASEKQSDNHKDFIRAIFNAMMQDMGFGEEQALAMGKDFVQWHSNVQWYPVILWLGMGIELGMVGGHWMA